MSVEEMMADVEAVAKTGTVAKRLIDTASLQLLAAAYYHRGLGSDRDQYLEIARSAWAMAEGLPRNDCISKGMLGIAEKMQDIADRMAADIRSLE